MKRKYVGWIGIEKEKGFKDIFDVHVRQDGQEPFRLVTGYGTAGAATAVAFFEEKQASIVFAGQTVVHEGLGLGHVKLEPTPIGLRVFVEENDESVQATLPAEVARKICPYCDRESCSEFCPGQ